MSEEASEACQRLRESYHFQPSNNRRRKRDIDIACAHVNDYDKDAVMVMLGYYFPDPETFENAEEEFADDDIYGEGSADRMAYSFRRIAEDYKEYS